MKPQCHHPPYYMEVPSHVGKHDLARALEHAITDYKAVPVLPEGVGLFVVECSWCRKPYEDDREIVIRDDAGNIIKEISHE